MVTLIKTRRKWNDLGIPVGVSHKRYTDSSAKQSSWVRDLDLVFPMESVNEHWFWDGMFRGVGDGFTTRFWYDTWFGSSSLMCRYCRLFSINITPTDTICNFGSWVGDSWVWNFTWRRHLFTWELDLLSSLLDELKSVRLQRHTIDSWEWRFDSSKIYPVKSAYNLLILSSSLPFDNAQHSYSIWKSKTPLRVITFAWKLFMDKIPSKTTLSRRGVSFSNDGGLLCPFCNVDTKSASHLFSSCIVTYSV
ncbi:hypothetical protein Lal_00045692 [Lupinus albus]|nr:hypothetical protein Lal_00045692 [Lupinus albus]